MAEKKPNIFQEVLNCSAFRGTDEGTSKIEQLRAIKVETNSLVVPTGG